MDSFQTFFKFVCITQAVDLSECHAGSVYCKIVRSSSELLHMTVSNATENCASIRVGALVVK